MRRKEHFLFCKRQGEVGFVMVWADFRWQGKTDIVFLNNRNNDRDYQKVYHVLTRGKKHFSTTKSYQVMAL